MATLILRPNGDNTVACTPVGSASNYANVNKVDLEYTTYNYTDASGVKDLFNYPNHTAETDVIGIVTLKGYFSVQGYNYYPTVNHHIIISGTTYSGSEQLIEGIVNYSRNFFTNPATGVAWTWADIDALVAGYSLSGVGKKICYQFWVEVLYALPAPPTPYVASIVQDISATTAHAYGTILSVNQDNATERGFCYSTSPNPTTDDLKDYETGDFGTGDFDLVITHLTPNHTWYIRAYAINEYGTGYSELENPTFTNFTPTVTTATVSNIQAKNAAGGGEITVSTGSATGGVCWNTAGSPTIADSHSDGTGDWINTYRDGVWVWVKAFTSSLTGLTPNTLYYYRAWSTNDVGTVYGEEKTFTTLTGIPTLTTAAVSNIQAKTCTGGGNATSGNGDTVTGRGVCWNTAGSPTILDPHTSDGSGLGIFSSSITGLTKNTLYYIRSYATTSSGTGYGNQQTFTTLTGIPSLTTTTVSNIQAETATGGGNVTSGTGDTVIERGICWNTAGTPTITDSHTSDGVGLGTFSSSIVGLVKNTLYYVRAYGTTSCGTGYGSQQTFTTLNGIPVLGTTEVTIIETGTATVLGNVANSGGYNITARGICWGVSENPTLANDYTTNGARIGNFISNIVGLSAGTLYYVRPWATNSYTTVFGTEVSFTTVFKEIIQQVASYVAAIL